MKGCTDIVLSEREFENLKEKVAVDDEAPYMRTSDIKMMRLFDFDRLIRRNFSSVKAQNLIGLNGTPMNDNYDDDR